MAKWKKLITFSMLSNEKIACFKNIKDKFIFPLLQKLKLSIFHLTKEGNIPELSFSKIDKSIQS